MINTASEEIKPGSLVGLRSEDENPEIKERLLRWIAAYGKGPFRVRTKPTPNHVVLEDQNEKEIHFGNIESSMFNIIYVELWRKK